jgi:hypothetical protein
MAVEQSLWPSSEHQGGGQGTSVVQGGISRIVVRPISTFPQRAHLSVGRDWPI